MRQDRFRWVPRFFFHLHDDLDCPDHEGVELPNLEAARLVAVHNARFTAAETIKAKGYFVPDHRIDIENDQGQVLYTICFRDAVKFET